MSFAGVANGGCRITAFTGFWNLGQNVKYGRLLLSKRERMVEKFAISFVIILAPFLILRNSALPFNNPNIYSHYSPYKNIISPPFRHTSHDC
jgi:hypothetical protein